MIVTNESASARINSPMNLMNRLKTNNTRKSAMSLFIKPNETVVNPFAQSITVAATAPEIKKSQTLILNQPKVEEPQLNNLIENSESQIKLGLAHDKALDLLNRSVEMLSNKLDDVSAAKLPAVISAASKTVESIRRERLEQSKNSKGEHEVHYHFYTPEKKNISDYAIIDVGGV